VANLARTRDLLNHYCGHWTRSNGCVCVSGRYDDRHHFCGRLWCHHPIFHWS